MDQELLVIEIESDRLKQGFTLQRMFLRKRMVSAFLKMIKIRDVVFMNIY